MALTQESNESKAREIEQLNESKARDIEQLKEQLEQLKESYASSEKSNFFRLLVTSVSDISKEKTRQDLLDEIKHFEVITSHKKSTCKRGSSTGDHCSSLNDDQSSKTTYVWPNDMSISSFRRESIRNLKCDSTILHVVFDEQKVKAYITTVLSEAPCSIALSDFEAKFLTECNFVRSFRCALSEAMMFHKKDSLPEAAVIQPLFQMYCAGLLESFSVFGMQITDIRNVSLKAVIDVSRRNAINEAPLASKEMGLNGHADVCIAPIPQAHAAGGSQSGFSGREFPQWVTTSTFYSIIFI